GGRLAPRLAPNPRLSLVPSFNRRPRRVARRRRAGNDQTGDGEILPLRRQINLDHYAGAARCNGRQNIFFGALEQLPLAVDPEEDVRLLRDEEFIEVIVGGRDREAPLIGRRVNADQFIQLGGASAFVPDLDLQATNPLLRLMADDAPGDDEDDPRHNWPS